MPDPTAQTESAIRIHNLWHAYPAPQPARRAGRRGSPPHNTGSNNTPDTNDAGVALRGLSCDLPAHRFTAILGPNGSGKSTLFRILTTALSPQQPPEARAESGSTPGADASSAEATSILVLGHALPDEAPAVRRRLGVVFQSPSLDEHLTVAENLKHAGHLYGLRGSALSRRLRESASQLGVADRLDDRVAQLSGGLARRVEIAKALLPQPDLLLLDEPTTGLDPAARRQFWDALDRLRAVRPITVAATTHLMDEADRADHTLVLHQGRCVAAGPPARLKAQLTPLVLWVHPAAADPDAIDALRHDLAARYTIAPTADPRANPDNNPIPTAAPIFDGQAFRIERPDAAQLVPDLQHAFAHRIDRLTLGPATLQDVFFHHTGTRFADEPT